MTAEPKSKYWDFEVTTRESQRLQFDKPLTWQEAVDAWGNNEYEVVARIPLDEETDEDAARPVKRRDPLI